MHGRLKKLEVLGPSGGKSTSGIEFAPASLKNRRFFTPEKPKHCYAQHARQPNRRPSVLACGVGVERCHLCVQQCPEHQLFKIRQEAIPASHLLLVGVFQLGKGLLYRAFQCV
jgi:hypothetical protein